MFARILRVGNAVAEIEVEGFQQAILEVVTLNHSEVLHVFTADLKFHAGSREFDMFMEMRGGKPLKGAKFTTEAAINL